MDHALACAPHETIIEWLARLNVTTKSQYRNEKDFILMAEAYLDELVKWPGDAVRETLTNWRDQWFPTLGAIKDAMKEIVGDRLMMARRLEQEP